METTERSFDTNVQLLKYKVIKGVVEHFDKGTLESAYRDMYHKRTLALYMLQL